MAFDASGLAAKLRRKGISVVNRGSGKARIGIRPKRASTVMKPKKAKGSVKTKTSSMSGDQAALEYRAADSPDKTGAPSSPTKKRGDVPSREDVATYPKAEVRSDVRTTLPVDPLFQIEGFAGPTKSAAVVKESVSRRWVLSHAAKGVKERMKAPAEIGFGLLDRAEKHLSKAKDEPYARHRLNRSILGMAIKDTVHEVAKKKHAEDRSLGDQTKRWESPTRPEPGLSTPDRHRIHGNGDNKYIQLSDISTSVGQDEADTTKRAMVEELAALGVLSVAQLSKLATVSDEAAMSAYKRLGKLESERPTPGQGSRGCSRICSSSSSYYGFETCSWQESRWWTWPV